ncbi:MAG: hypothetical protein P9F19_18385 [Candidatus Contendobacter sp.]|nr:hypothetical protein [Candidatus Contendobacter sp.]MDG4559336.1 hypothetical protein [Candidatus Contendobacter sp.]
MTLPRFLHANPVATLTTLDDDGTIAYRALLGRWLIDLALLDWVRAGRHHPFHHHRCWDNDEFMACLKDRVASLNVIPSLAELVRRPATA